MKIRTSIKTGNPTLWQGPTVRSSLNFYILLHTNTNQMITHDYQGMSFSFRVVLKLGLELAFRFLRALPTSDRLRTLGILWSAASRYQLHM
jgi:hypothetical protein